MSAAVVTEVNPKQCPTCDRIYAKRGTMLAHTAGGKCKGRKVQAASSSGAGAISALPTPEEQIHEEAPVHEEQEQEQLWEGDCIENYPPVHPDVAARARAKSLGPTWKEIAWAHDPEVSSRFRRMREGLEDILEDFFTEMIKLERIHGSDHPVMQWSYRAFDEFVITMLTLEPNDFKKMSLESASLSQV